MSLTEQQEFRDGFIRGYMAGDQTIGGNLPTIVDRPGPVGDPGPKGPANIVVGPAGDPGLAGLAGPIGFDGDRGATGTNGVDNFTKGPPGIAGLKGPVGDSPQGDQGNPGLNGLSGSKQKVITNIQFYADGYIATYADASVANCAAIKDIDGRITLLTNTTVVPNKVTTMVYNVGNMP